MQQRLRPFWDEIERCVSLAARYHDFEITRSYQRGCVWEEQRSETCVYRMTHTRIQVEARMDDSVRAQFSILSCIPLARAPIQHAPRRQQFWLEGRVDGDDRFVFADGSTSTQFVLLLKQLLVEEAVVGICDDRGLSVSSSLRQQLIVSMVYERGNRFLPKLRIDCTVPEAEEWLLSVHFCESYFLSATADPPVAEPVHFPNTSALIRFIANELDHPRSGLFRTIRGLFSSK